MLAASLGLASQALFPALASAVLEHQGTISTDTAWSDDDVHVVVGTVTAWGTSEMR